MIDTRDLRRALGTFATGVTVVTTIDASGEPRGFTANSFTSVSLDPPLVLVCVAKSALSCDTFTQARAFAVNILAESQENVSGIFASQIEKRFEHVRWSKGQTQSPLLDDVAGWLDCERHDVIDAGDHFILLGKIADYHYNTQTPLGYCRGAYVTFGLAEQAIRASQDEGPSCVAAIIEKAGAVLLHYDAENDLWLLPIAKRLGHENMPDSLLHKLSQNGIKTELSFLFAVYEEPDTGVQNIVYRGEAIDSGDNNMFVDFDKIEWDKLKDDAVRVMLKRYVRERQEDTFGVYVGNAESGRVEVLAREDRDLSDNW